MNWIRESIRYLPLQFERMVASRSRMDVMLFLEGLTNWAFERRDIEGLVLVGSYARGTPKPDSDVDVVVLCRSMDVVLEGDWPELFGQVESSMIEDYGLLKSRRI